MVARALVLFWLSGYTLLVHGNWEAYSPQEMERLEIHLVSMGPSHDLFTSGGHTLLRIIDPISHSDMMYNWGAYSDEDPLFLWSFMRGTSEYYLLVEPTLPAFQKDIQAYPRDVFQDRIQLTVLQKRKLLQEIQSWLQQPAYFYHVWSKNCSTIVAELLDTATSGGIAPQLRGKVTVTYRDLWMTYFGSWTMLAVFADFLLNGEADHSLTQWDLRFTPILFRQYLQRVSAVDDGGLLTTKPLLNNGSKLYSHPVPYGVGERGYQALLLFFMLLTIGGIASKRLQRDRVTHRLSLLTQNLWGLFSVVVSTAVLIISLVSTREYFHFSAVLWVFWPLDIIFIGRRFSEKRLVLQHHLVRLHVLSWVGLGLFSSIGIVQQSMMHIGVYLIPVSCLFFLLRGYTGTASAASNFDLKLRARFR